MTTSNAHPMYQMTIHCTLPRNILSLSELSIPPRILRYCEGYQIIDNELVFKNLKDRAAIRDILAAIQSSSLVKSCKKIVCSINERLYLSGRVAVEDADVSKMSRKERIQINGLIQEGFFVFYNAPVAKALRWARTPASRRKAKKWSQEGGAFSVSVSFEDFDNIDEIRRLMRAESTGSGYGFGGADVSFSFDTIKSIVSAAKRLEKAKFKTRLYVSRNVFNALGYFECPIDIVENKTPSALIKSLS